MRDDVCVIGPINRSVAALSNHFSNTAAWKKATMEMLQGFNQTNVMWLNDIKTYVDGDYQEAKKAGGPTKYCVKIC